MAKMDREKFEDVLTALGESEMQLLRMMIDMPEDAILTTDTDILIARLLASDGLLDIDGNNKVTVPEDTRAAFREVWSDETMLRWRKRNWMYKCLEAARYLYGVMSWDSLKDMYALRYPDADMEEIRSLFETTPDFYRSFNEIGDRLVLNGYEQDDYYIFLEKEIQGNTPYYVPTREEIEELFDRGCLISGEAHQKMKAFITENFTCDDATAEIRLHDLYEAINNRSRLADIADRFASEHGCSFSSDEIQVRFIEQLMEMSRECRVRDNRGHDWYEMAGIMALRNNGGAGSSGTASASSKKSSGQVRRVKIGRNDPCPCGSGKKYKNCCLNRNLS